MKVNQNLEHGGTLIGPVNGPYYETWTNYFIKYIEVYAQQNVSHWGLTMQNEPMVKQPWQSMDWNSTMERVATSYRTTTSNGTSYRTKSSYECKIHSYDRRNGHKLSYEFRRTASYDRTTACGNFVVLLVERSYDDFVR
uniref:Glucosylceramidase n=1 Tax=Acrobeloides nanus TaxID=290746 RepID=A0A914DBR2_9BILA